ncbi:hypothetical protein JX580_04490 [Thiomicrospira microaerophila]|uniref:sigma factor-like helix-turn-helix DNA-binding protein n=1 Tax=Thiomicrospira microaerophila TaxID=406020 RepID=UPI00200DE0BF|nr:sigma factor-like helix-turn-helix DNA-binding protein [Thiomicrospira microaerophila]UQB43146.1 hypothetical protein JX580_04490 [Thiomicrospira microaerophila]
MNERPLFDDKGAIFNDVYFEPLPSETMTTFKARIWALWLENQSSAPDAPTHRPQQRISLETSPIDRAEPMSLREVGERLGVTGESIRAIEKKAIAKCQRWLSERGLSFDDLVNY